MRVENLKIKIEIKNLQEQLNATKYKQLELKKICHLFECHFLNQH